MRVGVALPLRFPEAVNVDWVPLRVHEGDAEARGLADAVDGEAVRVPVIVSTWVGDHVTRWLAVAVGDGESVGVALRRQEAVGVGVGVAVGVRSRDLLSVEETVPGQDGEWVPVGVPLRVAVGLVDRAWETLAERVGDGTDQVTVWVAV